MSERRIVFACPFPRDQIAGGIRTTYRHAEMLRNHGVDVSVFSPDGHPVWFKSAAQVIDGTTLTVTPTDIIVVNEIIDDVSMNFLRLPARAHMFCQNQFYSFGSKLGMRNHCDLGIDSVYCASESIRDFYTSIYGYDDMSVIPYSVDDALFCPRPKALQIAYVPRKLPFEAEFIRTAFMKKYPNYRSVSWWPIDGKSEEEAAEIMGKSAVFLALGHRDSFGLPAIEAMSSGCAVVGFHGGGGLEFAHSDNGLWFYNDQVLNCVDALYSTVSGWEQQSQDVLRRIESGRQTAAGYNARRTLAALLKHFKFEAMHGGD
jgi:Glycosyl transferases group 1